MIKWLLDFYTSSGQMISVAKNGFLVDCYMQDSRQKSIGYVLGFTISTWEFLCLKDAPNWLIVMIFLVELFKRISWGKARLLSSLVHSYPLVSLFVVSLFRIAGFVYIHSIGFFVSLLLSCSLFFISHRVAHTMPYFDSVLIINSNIGGLLQLRRIG